jgi:nucleoside-triphosphatase THEP1
MAAGSPGHRRIAALQGASGAQAQELLQSFVRDSRQNGLRVAGVIELSSCGAEGGCKTLSVQDLASGRIFPISQKLGRQSEACNLDPGGLSLACAAVEQAIEAGAEVVVLSKFGKLEAARAGLCDAFRAAILADLPILTVVPAVLRSDWERFAGDLAGFIEADRSSVSDWWRAASA